MKILVLNNAAPFVRGGAEALADELVRRLNAVEGVESELIRIPFQWIPSERLIEDTGCRAGAHAWVRASTIGGRWDYVNDLTGLPGVS